MIIDSDIHARYDIRRKRHGASLGNRLGECELPGEAVKRAVEWSLKLKEPICVVDQILECIPVIVEYRPLEAFAMQVCRYRRVLVRYERHDPRLDAYYQVERLDEITRVLRRIRSAMNRMGRSSNGNGSVLVF